MTTSTLDALGRLTNLANKTGGGTSLSNFAVPSTGGYDGVGNRLSLTATLNTSYAPASYSGTTGYTYDYGSTTATARRSQVTQEASSRGGSYTNVYGYDGGTTGGPGNPTSFKGVTNTFNSNNQMTNTGYGYDGNGNPTTYKTNTLTFDPENRLTSYGSVQTDGYSADGLRAWKQAGGTTTYLLYDGSQPVCEINSSGTVTATNTFGADRLVSRRSLTGTPATTFYTFDERGNVTQRTTSTGTVASTDLYDSYGSRTGTVGQSDPFGFEAKAGYYTDLETGLLLCTHRFYDPATGRFLTRDPIGYDGGLNLYGYTKNNSINDNDPDGFKSANQCFWDFVKQMAACNLALIAATTGYAFRFCKGQMALAALECAEFIEQPVAYAWCITQKLALTKCGQTAIAVGIVALIAYQVAANVAYKNCLKNCPPSKSPPVRRSDVT